MQRSRYFKLVLLPTLLFSLVQSVAGERIDSSIGSIVRLFSFQFYIAIVLLSYEIYHGRISETFWRLALYFAVAISTLLGLSTGLLENAIVPLLLVLIVRWHVKGRFPISWLAVGFVLFLVLNSIKADYRRQIWTDKSDTSLSGRTTTWFTLGQRVVTDLFTGDGPPLQDTFRKAMIRFDLLHQFIWVQQMTPTSVPFYEGFSYRYLLYGWIPRVMWIDKPSVMEDTLTTSKDYRFLAQGDNVTSLGIGHLPEAYANFGIPGIVIIMALQGVVFCLVDHIFNGPRSEGGRAVYLTIMIFFLNGIGSATVALFLLIAPNAVANSLILYAFCRRWKAPRRVVNAVR